MALERKKLFGCPSCGFRVNGVEASCPRCNAEFGKDVRFECPFCGETVAPSMKECPSCHTTYDAFVSEAEKRLTDESIDRLLTDIIEKESKQVREEGKRLSCPKCNWMVDRTEEKCPRCGIVFSEAVAYQCPICAALVAADTEICEECKAVFVTEETDTSRAQVASVERAVRDESESIRAAAQVPEIVRLPPESQPKAMSKPAEKAVLVKPRRAMTSVSKRVEEAEPPAPPPRKRVRRRRLKPKSQQ